MSVGTGTALAIAGLAGAGASLYGANKQATAAQQASQQQQAAAQQALQQTSPLYQQALQIAQQQAAQGQARLDPYAQQGAAGLTALSAFLGVPAPSGAPNPALSPYAPTPAQQASANAFMPTAVARNPNPTAVPWSTTPGPGLVAVQSRGGQPGYVPIARLGDAGAAGATSLDPTVPMPGRTSAHALPATVLLEAPDGTRRAVPLADGPALIAKGAKMVG
jgi:hypothetical protein